MFSIGVLAEGVNAKLSADSRSTLNAGGGVTGSRIAKVTTWCATTVLAGDWTFTDMSKTPQLVNVCVTVCPRKSSGEPSPKFQVNVSGAHPNDPDVAAVNVTGLKIRQTGSVTEQVALSLVKEMKTSPGVNVGQSAKAAGASSRMVNAIAVRRTSAILRYPKRSRRCTTAG
jgi:hypothetical protein